MRLRGSEYHCSRLGPPSRSKDITQDIAHAGCARVAQDVFIGIRRRVSGLARNDEGQDVPLRTFGSESAPVSKCLRANDPRASVVPFSSCIGLRSLGHARHDNSLPRGLDTSWNALDVSEAALAKKRGPLRRLEQCVVRPQLAIRETPPSLCHAECQIHPAQRARAFQQYERSARLEQLDDASDRSLQIARGVQDISRDHDVERVRHEALFQR